MKHTKGPWTAKSYARTNRCYVTGAYGVVLFEETTQETDTVSPNARLIAAAPDLLEALEALFEFLPKERTEDWTVARAAVKKARGEA